MLCSFNSDNIQTTIVVDNKIKSIYTNDSSLVIVYIDNTENRYYFSNNEEKHDVYSILVDTWFEYYRLHNME